MRSHLAPLLRRVAPASAIFFCLFSFAGAQDADFKIQGEFAGASLAVQVIANGSGHFTAVFLGGGLPGAGWDGKTRAEAPGSLQSGQGVFQGGGYTATVVASGDTLIGKAAVGPEFTLTKVTRKSPTLGATAPAGAVVLFEGKDVSEWTNATLSSDKLLLPGSPYASTKRAFNGFTLHVEFREPYLPTSSGQQRGNSGIYLQGRQELQILDSFGKAISHPPKDTCCLPSMEECGAFFDHYEPLVNMCFPPLSWQTYDIAYTAAKYSGATMTAPARVTVRQNGVVIHDDRPLPWPTLLGNPLGPDAGSFWFQYLHGSDPVAFRNVWVVDGDPAALAPLPRSGAARAHGPRTPSAKTRTVDGRSVAAPRPAAGYHTGYPQP